MRIALLLPSLLLACNTAPADEAAPATSADLSEAATIYKDMDNNGVDDVLQSFVIGSYEGNAAVIVDPGMKSPEGMASDQDAEFRGYGSGMYVEYENDTPEDNAWSDGFFPAVEVTDNDSGELVGYGNIGWRPGSYEVGMANVGASIGELDDWWLLQLGVSSSVDNLDYLVLHLDGVAGGCERESWHLAFTVWQDGSVSPIGYSIAPEDPNCY